jgi:3-deoxy-D-manno-octulosonic-acid transferase
MDRIGAGSADDAERLLALGARAESVTVTGNLKYDLPVPVLDPLELRRRFGLDPSRPVLVAGSTGEGEDAPVLDAFQAVQQEGSQAFLVLAPRHPERADRAAELARARGLRTHVLSGGNDAAAGATDVLVVDGVGELARLYGMATVAFVGGSLVPVGGHNVLEPAAAGVPVLFGPHTAHVEEPAQALLEAGAARRVADWQALASTWKALGRDRAARQAMVEAARRVLDQNRGALARTTELLEGLL